MQHSKLYVLVKSPPIKVGFFVFVILYFYVMSRFLNVLVYKVSQTYFDGFR